jgi:hypothetical protein
MEVGPVTGAGNFRGKRYDRRARPLEGRQATVVLSVDVPNPIGWKISIENDSEGVSYSCIFFSRI